MPYSISLRQMRYFIAVAEERHFRRAAERLHITQPPLSRQIRLLEEGLGTRLLERNRQGVHLTQAGERFLVQASALVRQAQQIVMGFQPQEDEGRHPTVRLGITTAIDVSLFAWIESAMAARFPDVRVRIERQISAHSIRDLHRGRINAAVIGLPARAEGLTIEHLCNDPLVACIASRHPCARRKRISILDLTDDNLFWFARKLNPAYYDHCQQMFEQLGFFPNRLPEPDDHHVLLGLIAAGQGIALVPKSLHAVTRKGVVFKPLLQGDQLCVRIAVTYRTDAATEHVLALIAMLKERFSGQAMDFVI